MLFRNHKRQYVEHYKWHYFSGNYCLRHYRNERKKCTITCHVPTSKNQPKNISCKQKHSGRYITKIISKLGIMLKKLVFKNKN